MYLDNNTAYKKHVTTLKHRNNVRLVNAEIIKNGSKFECVTCTTTLSQYSVDQHLKTKMHLDKVGGKDLGFIPVVDVILSYHSHLDIYLIYIIVIINVYYGV